MLARFNKLNIYVQWALILIVFGALWVPRFLHLPEIISHSEEPVFQLSFEWLQNLPIISAILTMLIIIISAFLFRSSLDHDRTRISSMRSPILLFIIFASSPHVAVFSPVIITLPIFCLAMFFALKVMETRDNDSVIFLSALILGIAAIFYLTFSPIILTLMITLFGFEKSSPRKAMVVFLGFLFPWIWLSTGFYIFDNIAIFQNWEMAFQLPTTAIFSDFKTFIFLCLAIAIYLMFLINLLFKRYSEMVVFIRRRIILSACMGGIILATGVFSYDLYEHISLLTIPMVLMTSYYYYEKVKSSWIDYVLIFLLVAFIAYPYLTLWL